jgi:hypothetical protein
LSFGHFVFRQTVKATITDEKKDSVVHIREIAYISNFTNCVLMI